MLRVSGSSGNTTDIIVDSIGDYKLTGRFFLSNKEMQYGYKNILSCRFLREEEQQQFEEEQRYFSACARDTKNIKKRITYYKEYYQEVIRQHKKSDANEDKDNFTKRTLERYDNIFSHIYNHPDGLLLQYLLSQSVNASCMPDLDPVLLLSRSNYSQKQAIETALKDKISVIEGPPGTGKTTTILSIIANLIVRGKNVVVVSKNNSAIDNIKEELDNLALPPFYLRLGNSKIMDQLEQDIKELVRKTLEQTEQLSDVTSNKTELSRLYIKLKTMEADINRLVMVKNRLQEDENQLRHLEKRQKAFDEEREFHNIHRFKKKPLSVVQKEIDRIACGLQKIDASGSCSVWNRLKNRFLWKMNTDTFQTEGLLLQFQLEHIYLEREIEGLSFEIEHARLNKKQHKLADLYDGKYINFSLKSLSEFLFRYCSDDNYQVATQTILSCADNIMSTCRNEIRTIFPVILTTADALVYNFKDVLENGSKIDYIIMDEASQCDLIAGLPVLYMANRCVVVGDQKQLSAITGTPLSTLPAVEEPYDYYHETFLSSVKKVWNIQPTLLREHYRCDYSIINYCNKFYYNGELIIYSDKHEDSMQLLKVDQGKYATISKSGKSFHNEREVETIKEIAGSKLDKSYVITPFSGQGNLLKDSFHCDENTCGTIHTFQGKGQDTVYFSTVFNDLDFANRHLGGDHCLFQKELLNVAVSRAKKRFVLVSDTPYLRKKNMEMRNLIDYIETYGKEIPDKTTCIFDGLYKQMKAYTKTEHLDNIFEKKFVNSWKSIVKNILDLVVYLNCLWVAW